MSNQDDRKLLVSYDVYSDARVRVITITRIFTQSELASFILATIDEFNSQHFWNNLRVEYFEGVPDEQLEILRFLRDFRNEIDDQEMSVLTKEKRAVTEVIDTLFTSFSERGLQTLEAAMRLLDSDE